MWCWITDYHGEPQKLCDRFINATQKLTKFCL